MTLPHRAARSLSVSLLTGFLGAGKTTLLAGWLEMPALADTAVIVNEFGAVGVDDALMGVAGDRLALTTGCLCCAARGDLLDAIASLLMRRARGELAFSRIVVETTGLADPGPVLAALSADPTATRLAGVLTLVSAVEGAAALDRHPEARRQVALADRLLVTKADLDPESATALAGRLALLNPTAPIEDARDADPSALLEGSGLARAPRPGAEPLHHHGADARVRSVVLDAGPVDRGRLGAFLELALARHGGAMLRLKGLVAIGGELDRPWVVQAVGQVLYPATRLDGWGAEAPRTRLVAILDGADPAHLSRLWEDMFGHPAIDRPDAAALMAGLRGGPGLF